MCLIPLPATGTEPELGKEPEKVRGERCSRGLCPAFWLAGPDHGLARGCEEGRATLSFLSTLLLLRSLPFSSPRLFSTTLPPCEMLQLETPAWGTCSPRDAHPCRPEILLPGKAASLAQPSSWDPLGICRGSTDKIRTDERGRREQGKQKDAISLSFPTTVA